MCAKPRSLTQWVLTLLFAVSLSACGKGYFSDGQMPFFGSTSTTTDLENLSGSSSQDGDTEFGDSFDDGGFGDEGSGDIKADSDDSIKDFSDGLEFQETGPIGGGFASAGGGDGDWIDPGHVNGGGDDPL